MSTFESSIREIPHAQESVYNRVSDLTNLSKIKEALPEDKTNELEFTSDTLKVKVNPVGTISLKITEKEEPKMVKFETESSPLAFRFWIQIVPLTEKSCKIKLTVKADLNPFIKGMVKGPLTEGIEKIADVLQTIDYSKL